MPIPPNKDCYAYAIEIGKADFKFLSDGVKHEKDGTKKILVLGGCIFTHAGNLKLKDGKSIDFFQEDAFNVNGLLTYWQGTLTKVPDGIYLLENVKELTIKEGRLQNDGFVCGTDFCFSDSD